jgi:tRNA(fMet)-specific endonuclease VapC
VAVTLALDTNRYADLCRGNPRAVEIIEAADAIRLPFVVLGELRAGFAAGTQGPRKM